MKYGEYGKINKLLSKIRSLCKKKKRIRMRQEILMRNLKGISC